MHGNIMVARRSLVERQLGTSSSLEEAVWGQTPVCGEASRGADGAGTGRALAKEPLAAECGERRGRVRTEYGRETGPFSVRIYNKCD